MPNGDYVDPVCRCPVCITNNPSNGNSIDETANNAGSSDSVETESFACYECGGESDNQDSFVTIRDNSYCTDCVSDCDHCGDSYPSSDSNWLDAQGIDVCYPCWRNRSRCYTCDIHYVGDECPFIDNDSECNECGGLFNPHYDSHDCDSCDCGDPDCSSNSDYESERDATSDLGLRNYSFRPTPLFLGTGPLFMGVEIETHVESVYRDEVREMLYQFSKTGYAYAKSDSSIGYGFELVTMPFEPAAFLSGSFRKELPLHLLDTAIENGWIDRTYASGEAETGLHVSLSRKAFTRSHLWKFLTVHNHYAELFGFIGGRGTNNRWGSFDPLSRKETIRMKANNVPTYDDRYCAVNTNNPERIEIRYAKGDSSSAGVRRLIEWNLALFHFTRDHLTHDAVKRGIHRDPMAFVDYVKRNRKAYPLMARELANHESNGTLKPYLTKKAVN